MIRNLFLIALLIVSFSSCAPDTLYTGVHTTGNSWKADSTATFDINLTENQDHSAYIYLKHNGNYGYSNFFLFSELTFPDGMVRTDTLQYFLAQPDGKWLGSGWGDLKSIKLLYPVQFEQTGNYKLELRQGMRETDLEGIEQIGLAIEALN